MKTTTRRFILAGALTLSGLRSAAASAAPVASHFVATQSGLRIHYLESGARGSARAVVLLPGWRLPAFLWEEQLVALASTTRAVAIDPRSQGDSTATPRDNTPETRAEDLHEVLEKLRIASPVLVGWSQGVQDVAAYLARYGPESVAGVVFVESPVLAGPAEVELHPQWVRFMLAGVPSYLAKPDEYSRRMVQYLFKKPHPSLDLEKILAATLKTPVETGVAMLIVDIVGVDRRPVLAKLTRPTLVVASAGSPLLQAQKDMAAAIPGARLLVLEDTGMAVFLDEPERFTAALVDLVRALPAP